MADPVLLRKTGDRVATLTLNRPARRNALDLALIEALLDALDAAEADSAVRAVILTGAGGAFSAGADLKEFETAPADDPGRKRRAELMANLFAQPGEMTVPVIAAVDGFALGGGAALALACDMIVASDGARFGYPEIRIGMVPAGVVPPLLRRVGRGTAFDLIATGRAAHADEALRLGIVQRVVAPERLMDEASGIAAALAAHDGAVVAAAKRLIRALAAADSRAERDRAVERARAAGGR